MTKVLQEAVTTEGRNEAWQWRVAKEAVAKEGCNEAWGQWSQWRITTEHCGIAVDVCNREDQGSGWVAVAVR